MRIDVLVVGNETDGRESLARTLRTSGHSVATAASARAARAEMIGTRPRLVLLDAAQSDGAWLDLLRELKRTDSDTAIIAMTDRRCVKDAVLAMKAGARDCLTKPVDIDSLQALVTEVLMDACSEEEEYCPVPTKCDESRIIGKSREIRSILATIDKIPQDSRVNVLLEGETGTGKDLVAHAIHELCGQRQEPFIAINCGAIPGELMESELFGYEKGAFTGASSSGRRGLLEQASRGVVFLDEISELRPDLQVKLLRVIDAREFTRIGGRRKVRLHARVVAATNSDLRQEVRLGRFREDLYYRLNVVRIWLPPLRERAGDVMLLAEAFLRDFRARYGKAFTSFHPRARRILGRHSWPGNVRELRNVIERAVLMETGDTILPGHLPEEVRSVDSPAPLANAFEAPPERKSLEDIERECIRRTLEMAAGNVVKAAGLLGLQRGAMRYRMSKYGIREGAIDEPAGGRRDSGGAVGLR